MSHFDDLRKAFSGWLKPAPLLLALLLFLGAGAIAVNVRYDKPVKELVAGNPPSGPDFDLDNGRGEGLTRGRSVGAEPSKAYPRPDSFFTDRGIKFAFVKTQNWSSRGTGDPIEAIVVHVTGPGTLAGMDNWFANPASQVSAHFGVDKNGDVHQYVELGDVAWHAGIVNKPNLNNPLIASWVQQGINPNRRTVGIEMVLEPGQLIGEYPKLATSFDALLYYLLTNLRIPADRVHVIGHNELDSINRSQDPVCCWWPDAGVAYAASLINPPAPPAAPIEMQVTLDSINQRLIEVEKRLGIGQ